MKNLYVFLILSVIGIAVYANSFQNDFVWDDEYLITKNTHVQLPSLTNALQLFKDNLGLYGGNKNNFYRPLQELSYMLNFAAAGLNPPAFHLVNLLLHLLAVYLIYLVIKEISKDSLIALAASVLYLMHPLHVEAVTYIAGRADPLFASFFLLALYLYIKYEENGRISYLCLSALSFIFALISKEIAIILPVIIIFYDYTFHESKSSVGKAVSRYIPYVLIAAVYIALRASVLNFKAPVAIMPAGVGLYERTLTFFRAFFEYARLIVFPFDLHMERRIPFAKSLLQPEVLFCALFVMAVIAIMIFARRRSKLVFFGLGWFFITIFPLSGIPMPMNAIVSEHFMYLPLVGISLIAGLGIRRAGRYAPFLLLPIALYFSFITVHQNAVWRDEITFFEHNLKYQPNNPKLHLNFGNTYSEYNMLDKALEQYNIAIRLEPGYSAAYNNIGQVYMQRGDVEGAITMYKKAISIEDDYADAHFNLGNAYDRKSMLNESLAEYKKALEFAPPYAGDIWNNIGIVYEKMAKPDEAIGAYKEGLKISPGDPYLRSNLNTALKKR